MLFAPITHACTHTHTHATHGAPFHSSPYLHLKFRRALCSPSLFFRLDFNPPTSYPFFNKLPRPLPVVPPQASPPPPPPPQASDSTSAGERSPDGCHRWAFPLELPALAQCVLGRVRSQASPWNACCNRKQKKGPPTPPTAAVPPPSASSPIPKTGGKLWSSPGRVSESEGCWGVKSRRGRVTEKREQHLRRRKQGDVRGHFLPGCQMDNFALSHWALSFALCLMCPCRCVGALLSH